jgi:hypothetical protein
VTSMHRIRVLWTGSVVGPAVSTLFLVPTAPTDATAQACVTKVGAFLTGIKAGIGAGTTWSVSGNVDDVDGVTGDLTGFHAVTASNDGGSATGQPAPPANQVNIRLETGQIVNGHRVRGHLYIPGYSQFDSLGHVTGTIVSSTATAAPAFLSATNPPVVWHRPVGRHGATRPGAIFTITSMNVAPKMAVLRSRRD